MTKYICIVFTGEEEVDQKIRLRKEVADILRAKSVWEALLHHAWEHSYTIDIWMKEEDA